MELADLIDLITAIALVATLGVIIWYTVIANKQRKITAEALQLQKDVRQDELASNDLRFELRPRLAYSSPTSFRLVNRGPDLIEWSVSPTDMPDAIWAVSPASGDLWKSGDEHKLNFAKDEEAARSDTRHMFRISYTGRQGDPTTKCFRIVPRGVVPETCPEDEHWLAV